MLERAHWAARYSAMREEYGVPDGVRFNGYGVVLHGPGRISVGPGTYIGSNSVFQAALGCSVEIGEGCAISHNVRIYTLTYDADQDFMVPGVRATKSGDVRIGSGVWIGANVLIGPGLTIGNNAVIGANSVVCTDVGDSEICGGVPAKLIRKKRQRAN